MFWEDGASAVTVGFGISCGIGLLPAIWVLWKYRSGISDSGEALTHSQMWKRIAPYAVWLWMSNLLCNLIEVADRYMLIHWSTLPAEQAQGTVGQYHSGQVVPLLLTSVATMLAGVLIPYMSKAWEKDDREGAIKQLNWTVKLTSLVFTAGGVVVLLFSPLLFDWILQGRYSGGLSVLAPTLVYCIWYSLFAVGQNFLWIAEKGKWTALAIGVGLATNIILNMILIPLYGLHGAVIATSIGNLTIVSLLFGLNHWFGCRTDVGIWFCAGLPLILLLGKPSAVIAIVAVGLYLWTSDSVLSAEEKSDVGKLIREKLGKYLPK